MAAQRGRNTYLQSIGANDPDRKTPGHDWILLNWLTRARLEELGRAWFVADGWDEANFERLTAVARGHIDERVKEVRRELDSRRQAAARAKSHPHEYSPQTADERERDVKHWEEELAACENWPGLGAPPTAEWQLMKITDAHPLYNDQRSRVPAVYIDRLVEYLYTPSIGVVPGYGAGTYGYRKWLGMPRWCSDRHTPKVAFEVKTRIPSYSEIIQQLQAYRGYLPGAKIVVVCPDDTFKAPIEDQGLTFLTCPQPPTGSAGQAQLL